MNRLDQVTHGYGNKTRRLAESLMLVAGLLFLFLQPAAAQSKVGVLCLTNSNGVLVRGKCRSSETTLSISMLSQKGAVGDTGAAGTSGSLGREVVYTTYESVNIPNEGLERSQSCPAGKTTLSGGCLPIGPSVLVNRSYPFDGTPNQWRCGFVHREAGSVLADVIVYAICVDQ
ncbi:MAG: hypothetical protein EBZ48_13175 [Proteobacteria bacterium]|nr:hypothetical protein [Pseudomonadota bacterium]